MEYTNEMYEEDRKIAHFTFYKHYKIFKDYKEDLIQCALIKAPRARELWNKEKYTYTTYAVYYFRTQMSRFLEKEKIKNNLSNNLSLDKEVNDQETTLLDTLGYEQEFMEDYDYNILKKLVKDIILKPRYNDNKPLTNNRIEYLKRRKPHTKTAQKYAIEYFINGKTIQQIANEKGITRQAVSSAVEKYKKILQEELQKRGYNQ